MNTFIRNSLNLLGATLVSALLLVGCASPESNDDDSSTTTPQVTVPTAADLVGTWTVSYTYESDEEDDDGNEYVVSEDVTRTRTFAADGTYAFSAFKKITRVDSGAVSYESSEEQGTYTISEGTVRTVDLRSRFADAESVADVEWEDDNGYVMEDPSIIIDGKWFPYGVYKAEGTPSGFVGTWTKVSFNDDEYTKNTYTIGADKSFRYVSIDSTDQVFDEAPDTEFEGTYEVASDGVLTIDVGEGLTIPLNYKVAGNYLVDGSDIAPVGYTKQ